MGRCKNGPEGGARTKPFSTENSSSANRILRPRQRILTKVHAAKESLDIQGMLLYIFMIVVKHCRIYRCSHQCYHQKENRLPLGIQATYGGKPVLKPRLRFEKNRLGFDIQCLGITHRRERTCACQVLGFIRRDVTLRYDSAME